MWAIAKYDFGIPTFEEFGRLTPGMFMALLKRQTAKFKRDCYLAGLPTMAIFNVHRRKDNDKIWHPMDFVPDAERDSKREQLRQNIASLFGTMLEFGKQIDDIEKTKARLIENLAKAGYDEADIEEVFQEVFTKYRVRKKEEVKQQVVQAQSKVNAIAGEHPRRGVK